MSLVVGSTEMIISLFVGSTGIMMSLVIGSTEMIISLFVGSTGIMMSLVVGRSVNLAHSLRSWEADSSYSAYRSPLREHLRIHEIFIVDQNKSFFA